MADVVLGIGASHGSSTFAPARTWGFYADRDKRRRYYQDMLDRTAGSLDGRITPEHWEEEFQAGHVAGMQPIILSACFLERHLFVLATVAPHPDHVAVLCRHLERPAAPASTDTFGRSVEPVTSRL